MGAAIAVDAVGAVGEVTMTGPLASTKEGFHQLKTKYFVISNCYS